MNGEQVHDDEHHDGEHAEDGRDYAAAYAVLHEITGAVFATFEVWPTRLDDPAVRHLARLADRHGLFTILSVALGWAATEVRTMLAVPLGADLAPGTYQLRFTVRAQAADVVGVVGKLLEHVLCGVQGVPRLYDAAAMLRHDGAESCRVLLGVLDLCAQIRAGRVQAVRA